MKKAILLFICFIIYSSCEKDNIAPFVKPKPDKIMIPTEWYIKLHESDTASIN